MQCVVLLTTLNGSRKDNDRREGRKLGGEHDDSGDEVTRLVE